MKHATHTLTRGGSAVLVLAAFALAGCAEADDPQDPPALEISVTPDEIDAGDTVTVTIDVTDFELVEPHEHGAAIDDPQFRSHTPGHLPKQDVGSESKPMGAAYDGPREGMYHVYLDSTESQPLGMGHMETFEATVDADSGEHEIIVRLHGADHKVITPEITDAVPLTVR